MQPRTIKKGAIDIEISQDDGGYSSVMIYRLSNSKVFEMIDIWVMKDGPTGNPKALRAAATFKRDFNAKDLEAVLAKFDKETRLCLGEINSTYLSFDKLGKEKAKIKVDIFVANLCKIEGLERGSFDFMLDIPLLNNKEIHKECKDQDQEEPAEFRPAFRR